MYFLTIISSLICLVVSDDDGVKDSFIPKVLDFSEGGCYPFQRNSSFGIISSHSCSSFFHLFAGNTPTGKVSADKAEAEALKCSLIDTFGKDERFYVLRQQLQQTTSLPLGTLGGMLPEMLRVFGSSEYSSEFMVELMALLPSVAGLLGVNFKIFLLETLSKYEIFMKNMNKDDSPGGLRMKNLLLNSYHRLIQSLDTDNVLTSMIAELEVEKKDDGVHNVMNGILHLSSMLTPQRK